MSLVFFCLVLSAKHKTILVRIPLVKLGALFLALQILPENWFLNFSFPQAKCRSYSSAIHGLNFEHPRLHALSKCFTTDRDWSRVN